MDCGHNSGTDKVAEMQEFVADLMTDPDREQIASEIMVLQSIYGEDVIHLWKTPTSASTQSTKTSAAPGTTTRYVISLSLPSHDNVSIRILVSVPLSYPASSPPQLQLLSRYIGAFGTDSSLFGSVLRTFISLSGVQWSAGTVCVFDGLQNILERCEQWYEERLSRENESELVRGDTFVREPTPEDPTPLELATEVVAIELPREKFLLEGVQIIAAEPIVDRKSVFVGRACRISHPSQVPLILDYLMSDRHVARATHPTINAWRCKVGNVVHQDNDDNGESAAGSRLAHLLSILEIDDVLVVVTRWFGGIHLGPDRFKHINHAARNALEAAGLLDLDEGSRKTGRAPHKGRRR